MARVTSPHVLVTGHPYVDVWQAVKPSALGIAAWPVVPPGRPWKEGVCAALGVATPAEMWRRILSRVDSYADVETPLINAVERMIDFVTVPPAGDEPAPAGGVGRRPAPSVVAPSGSGVWAVGAGQRSRSGSRVKTKVAMSRAADPPVLVAQHGHRLAVLVTAGAAPAVALLGRKRPGRRAGCSRVRTSSSRCGSQANSYSSPIHHQRPQSSAISGGRALRPGPPRAASAPAPRRARW